MNYLAHLLLSQHSESQMIGNFLGDFVKGPVGQDYPELIRIGIQAHRDIDTYTNYHPVYQSHRRLFSASRRRYAGVILDIAYDHFLSRNWNLYSDESRPEFIDRVYGVLARYQEIFPTRALRFYRYMITEDVLNQYNEMAGIDLTLNRLAFRGKTHPALHHSADEVAGLYSRLENGFRQLFPDLQREFSVREVNQVPNQ